MLETMRSNEFRISTGDYIQFPAMGETMELMRQKRCHESHIKARQQIQSKPNKP